MFGVRVKPIGQTKKTCKTFRGPPDNSAILFLGASNNMVLLVDYSSKEKQRVFYISIIYDFLFFFWPFMALLIDKLKI